MAKIIHKLTPYEAAEISLAVYQLQDGVSITKAFQDTDLAKSFDFTNTTGTAQKFTARTGAFEFKSRTGFGVITSGQGKYERDALLVCRGTATLYDGLTDANTGIQLSSTGYKVHAGFNRTFNDFREDIIRFININQPRTVHCVGHSLGGALAHLAADLVINRGKQAALYTFGSPRVGFSDFANKLSLNNNIGIDNIFRVYHAGDPVSMVPLWPFVHAPQPKGECYIGKFLEFNPKQHSINNYIKSVAEKSWENLRRNHPNWDNFVSDWVTSDKFGDYYGLNFYNLTMVIKAIQYTIKEILKYALIPVNLLTTCGATILDQLSMLLEKASKMSTDSHSFIMSLMKRILKMVGMTMAKSQTLTVCFYTVSP